MIAIIGMGFVGEANAYLLSHHNDIICYDINPAVLAKYPQYRTTTDMAEACEADIFIICVPTDGTSGGLDCSLVENCIAEILLFKIKPIIIIRSTVSIGFTEQMRELYNADINFVPEFLREGSGLHDALNPSRIIASSSGIAHLFSRPVSNDPPVIICSNTEAEAIKLFSNSYLAGRVAFFNEIDTECMRYGLNSANVIKGMCADPRIGDYYNNPSFGFGGYCFPKDSQAVADTTIGSILKSIPESNSFRKIFMAKHISRKCEGEKIGVYKTSMKSGSNNSRCSAILDIIDMLDRDVMIYNESDNLKEFFKSVDVIICNRYEPELAGFSGEIITRDIFRRD